MTDKDETETRYSFHITFKDGSNPYWHFPTSEIEHNKALRKWKRGYKMRLIHATSDSITRTITEYYLAASKRKEANGDAAD